MDPLIGVVNQIQLDQPTALHLTPFSGQCVAHSAASRGGCGSPFETRPVAFWNTKPADPAGQRSAGENLGVPAELIQDLID